jgi:hypothetical protein
MNNSKSNTTARDPRQARTSFLQYHAPINWSRGVDVTRGYAPTRDIVDYIKTHIPVDQFTHASSHGSEPGRRIVFHTRVNHAGRIQLQKLKRRLTGVANVNPLPPTGRVRVVVSTIDTAHGGCTAFKAALKTLQTKTDSFIHAAVSIGPAVSPIYFAGFDARSNLYIVAMGDPGDLRPVSKKDRTIPDITKQLVDAGVFPRSLATIKRNVKGEHIIISDPSELVEIPSGIHRAYTKYIANGQNAGDAWVAAGGVTWSTALGLKFEFHELFDYDRTVPLTSIATLDTYVTKSLHRPVHGAAARKLESEPATAIAKSALQTLTTGGKPLGRGSYGTVYAITLDVRNLKLLSDLKKSLSNMLEFAPYGGKRQIVLKVERLDSYRPLTVGRRRRLVGESYIQQFVNDNRGLVTKSQLVVSPRVYFSGTIANSFNVICMDRVIGKPLSNIIRDRRVVSAHVYSALEAAIVTMLRNGIVHSDLHASNVFVSGSGRSLRVYILDFGFASLVPPAMKKKIANVLDRGGSVHDVFEQTGLANAVNASKRDFEYYHANNKLLTYVKKRQAPASGLRSHPAWNAHWGSTKMPMLFKNIPMLSPQLNLPTMTRTKTKLSSNSNVPVATPAWPPIAQTNRRVTVQ